MERYLDATWMIWIGRSSSQFKLPTQESHKTNGERSTEQPKGSRNRSRLEGGSDGVTVVGNLLSLLNFSLPQNNGRYAAPRRSPAPGSFDVCASAHSNSLCLGRIRCEVEFERVTVRFWVKLEHSWDWMWLCGIDWTTCVSRNSICRWWDYVVRLRLQRSRG